MEYANSRLRILHLVVKFNLIMKKGLILCKKVDSRRYHAEWKLLQSWVKPTINIKVQHLKTLVINGSIP